MLRVIRWVQPDSHKNIGNIENGLVLQLWYRNLQHLIVDKEGKL